MRTKFMTARFAFHANRTLETATAYVKATKEAGFPANIRAAVHAELKAAGFEETSQRPQVSKT